MVIALLPKSSSAEGFGGFLQWAPGIILIFGFVLLKGGGELAGRGSNPVTLEVKPEPSPSSKPPRSAHFPSLVLSDLQADILERLPDHAFESSLAFARTRVWSALSMV